MPQLRLQCHCGGGSFKSQFKKADRSGARVALVLGDDELDQGTIGIKPLRDQGEQQTVTLEVLPRALSSYVRTPSASDARPGAGDDLA
jgi:histidyl-tRNA synthetase